MKITKGFTLIELLLVITLSTLLAGFVGPLAFSVLDKAERKTEIHELRNLLKKLSYKAFIKQTSYKVTLTNSYLVVSDISSAKEEYSRLFKQLGFENQIIEINQNGFIYPDSIKLNYNSGEHTLNLSDSVNAVKTIMSE